MLVTQDDVRSGENIRLQVWDADRWNSDDGLGYVELPLAPLIESPGEMVTRYATTIMVLYGAHSPTVNF
jgi:Ca2+-dependent lipid-binding protein